MALQYEIKRQRNERMRFEKGTEVHNLRSNFTTEYQVYISDPANPNFNPETIGLAQILTQAQDINTAQNLPKVNKSVYQEADGIYPYMQCVSKEGRRDERNKHLIWVTCEFSTGEQPGTEEQSPQTPPVALENLAPQLEVINNEVEIVRYQDKQTPPQRTRTPTDNDFPEPFVERLASQIWRIKQYESFLSYSDMAARQFVVNEDPWPSDQLPFLPQPRYSWLIQRVEGTEALVPLLDGSKVNAALVTYTLELSPLTNGWKEDRALIDTHFLTTADDLSTKKPFREPETQTYYSGAINADGTRAAESQPPPYKQWEMYATSDFSFLQIT